MKATIDGVTHEGTEDEIRRIVEKPPARPVVGIRGQRVPSPTLCGQTTSRATGTARRKSRARGVGLAKTFYFALDTEVGDMIQYTRKEGEETWNI